MTMHMMFDYSRWWEVADQEGFILALPTSTNYGRATRWTPDAPSPSSDLTFIDQVVTDVKTNYNVDESRVYLNGQSHGSAMSQAIGRNPAYSKQFTALGTTSFTATATNGVEGETLPLHDPLGGVRLLALGADVPPGGWHAQLLDR